MNNTILHNDIWKYIIMKHVDISRREPKFIEDTLPWNKKVVRSIFERKPMKILLHVKPYIHQIDFDDYFNERIAFHIKLEIANIEKIGKEYKQYTSIQLYNKLLCCYEDTNELEYIFKIYKKYGRRHYKDYVMIIKRHEKQNIENPDLDLLNVPLHIKKYWKNIDNIIRREAEKGEVSF